MAIAAIIISAISAIAAVSIALLARGSQTTTRQTTLTSLQIAQESLQAARQARDIAQSARDLNATPDITVTHVGFLDHTGWITFSALNGGPDSYQSFRVWVMEDEH